MSLFRGDPNYKKGMNKMWKAREKLGRILDTGMLDPAAERRARYARDFLWEAMFGKAKRQEERDR